MRELQRLRRRGARLLVFVLAVDDRRVAVARVARHVLPDVQHGAAGRVDERAALILIALQIADRHAERRQDHDVLRPEPRGIFVRVAQEADAGRAQLVVDVRVVDDFAGQEHLAIREARARLIRVVDRAIDAVAEPELAREMDQQAA